MSPGSRPDGHRGRSRRRVDPRPPADLHSGRSLPRRLEVPPDGRSGGALAHPYVDTAHRAALLYSFATLLLAVFVELSGFSTARQPVAAFVADLLLRRRDRRLHDPRDAPRHRQPVPRPASPARHAFMWALIVGEIGGFAVLLRRTSSTARSEGPGGRPALRRGSLGQSGLDLRLEALLRHRADDGLGGLAALEDDHRRDRHDLVLAGGLLVLVDVEADDLDVVALAATSPRESDGRRGRGRTREPRSRRARARSDSSTSAWKLLSVTCGRLAILSSSSRLVGVGISVGYSDRCSSSSDTLLHKMKYWKRRCSAAASDQRRPRSRMIGTLQAASATIARLIFDSPTRRSLKTIGTSTTRNPARSAR